MSPLIPNYDADIFISYARIDNEPLIGPTMQKGWVDIMHQNLEKRLAQLLGEKPSFWRDLADLPGHGYIEQTLKDKVSRAAILLSFLSPGYIRSDWCKKELAGFFVSAMQTGGVQINNKSRIFKVVKTPIDAADYPAELSELHGYHFYEIDPVKKTLLEFRPEYGSESFEKFIKRLDELAWDIKEFIRYLQAGVSPPPVPSLKSSGLSVYLAPTTYELNAERDKIKHELQLNGHRVLPDEPLPLELGAVEQAVQNYLKQSQFSIHLIGPSYGIVPEREAQRSMARIQYDLAARHTSRDFFRLVWLPKGMQAVEDSRQQQFIDFVKQDASARAGDEFLQNRLEDLKTLIQTRITAITKPGKTPPPTPPPAELIRLYVICDKQDREQAEELKALLYDFNENIEVCLPLDEEDSVKASKDHRDNLLECDAAIIFYGQAGEFYVVQQLRDMRKYNHERATPLRLKEDRAVYVAFADGEPKKKSKEAYTTREASVVRNYGAISLAPLQPFLERLLNEKGRRYDDRDFRQAI
jgi:hypothetical protein